MGESLTERRRVVDEGLRVVNTCSGGGSLLTLPQEKGAPNHVPAGAVRREPRALPGITGRKGCVGGLVSRALKPGAQLRICVRNG